MARFLCWLFLLNSPSRVQGLSWSQAAGRRHTGAPGPPGSFPAGARPACTGAHPALREGGGGCVFSFVRQKSCPYLRALRRFFGSGAPGHRRRFQAPQGAESSRSRQVKRVTEARSRPLGGLRGRGGAGRRCECGGSGAPRGHAVLAGASARAERGAGRRGAAAAGRRPPPAGPLRQARAGGARGRGSPPLRPPARRRRLVRAGAAVLRPARPAAGAARPAPPRAAGLPPALRHLRRPLLLQVLPALSLRFSASPSH